MSEIPVPATLSEVRCPLCRRLVFHRYAIKGAGDDLTKCWLHCACDLIFNLYQPDRSKVFTEEYRKQYADRKEIAERYGWYIRNYATIIEEATYGRRFLDVGPCTPHMLQGMERRGWIVQGLDLIPSNDYQMGDFESFDFGTQQFDCLWLGDVLQCLTDPTAALKKCYQLLKPTGMLFIVTPDTDILRMGKFADFGHWDLESNRQFLSGSLLERLLMLASPDLRQGRFEIVYKAQNFSQRFPSWNNVHVLAQKVAFDV